MIIDVVKKKVQKALLETAEEEISQVKAGQKTPYKTGKLQDSYRVYEGNISKNEVAILVGGKDVDVVYAQRLYHHPEFNFNRKININAQGKWLSEEEERIIKIFKEKLGGK